MDSRLRILRIFAPKWIPDWVRFISYFIGFIFLLGVIAALYTGDWSLPLFFPLLLIFFLLRFLLILVIFFFPVVVAILVFWIGYIVLAKKPNKEKNETGSKATPS
jgi:predicted membrane protein